MIKLPWKNLKDKILNKSYLEFEEEINLYLNLDVPEYKGSVNIEFRLGPSGSRARKIEGEDYRVVGAGYRCQGRLKTEIRSNYSLDNAEDVKKLFGE